MTNKADFTFAVGMPPLHPIQAAVPKGATPRPAKRAKNTPPIDPSSVSQRIRLVVSECDSIRAAAERCSIPQPTLETYLSGQSLPGALAIARLCKGLSISADWLLFGEDVQQ